MQVMKKHPWYHFIFPVVFCLLSALIIFEGATPGNSSSNQSKLFASLFDHGNKVATIINAEGITLEGEDKLYIGKTNTYSVSFQPENTSDKRVNYQILEGKDIVSLEENRLTGIAEGDVVLQATGLANTSLTSTKTIHVQKEPITKLTIASSKSTITKGQTIFLNVKETTKDKVDFLYDSEFFEMKNQGYLKSIKEGNTTISCRLKENENVISEKISIRIEKGDYVAPTFIEYDSDRDIFINEKMEITPSFNEGCNDTLFYILENDVQQDTNQVCFDKAGDYKVTLVSASNAEVKKEVTFHAKKCKATSIHISLGSVQYGKSTKVSYTIASEKEGVEVTNSEVNFKSSDSSIASIDENGYILGYQKGNVNITISWKEDESISTVATITIISMDTSVYENINHIVRKLIGHFGCFLVTAVFGIISCFLFFFDTKKKKYFSTFIYLAIGLILAFLSEFLQLFMIDRGPSAQDVMIDFSGYLVGYIVTYLIYLAIMKKKKKKKETIVQ
jgi:VanZ family protein